jgi:hypothetical protein
MKTILNKQIQNHLKIISGILFVFCAYLSLQFVVEAETVNTSVTAGNSSPTFTAGPAESTTSDGTTPTNEGSNVTFQATATDSNAEDYYFAVCKTNTVTPGTSGAAPSCGGGNWCITTATDSGVQASCNYTTVNGDAESNVWYGFVCDNNTTSSSCSSSSQGTGGTGSPFKVNHDPAFSAVADDGGGGADSGANPGGAITFTATASDTDTDTANDTVTLVVCADTNGATISGCTGTQLCVSSAAASAPNCQINIASVAPDGNNNYYAYVFDSHSFASGSNYRSGVYVISNVSPSVSSVTLNAGGDITLAEGTTTNVVVTGTVTDNNSCQDLSTIETSAYRSAIGYSGCDANAEDDDNHCYAQVSCSVSGASCTGPTDASANYTCTVVFQYHADPTIANTVYPTETWKSTINAIDNNSASANTELTTGVEVLTTTALDVSAAINYGSLDVGQKNDPLDKTTTVTATGNVGLDEELSGTNLTDGGAGVIAVSKQKHALATSTSYASGTALSTSPTEYELNCLKTTASGSPQTKNTWWGIEIPAGIPPGAYAGTNTVTAVLGETANW